MTNTLQTFDLADLAQYTKEGVCAERYKAIQARLQRLEYVIHFLLLAVIGGRDVALKLFEALAKLTSRPRLSRRARARRSRARRIGWPRRRPPAIDSEINTPLRAAAWLAQCGHESVRLARTAESFDYSVATLPVTFRRATPALAATFGRQGNERMVLLERQQRIANIAYAGQYGNGDSGSGDGWTFRGSRSHPANFPVTISTHAGVTSRSTLPESLTACAPIPLSQRSSPRGSGRRRASTAYPMQATWLGS
jgi:hypothetical protein